VNKCSDSIGWADYTWNPITGCSPASPGCENCYAERISKRFGWHWGSPVFHPERLEEPLKLKKPSRIFVCSMGDFFHAKTKVDWIGKVLEIIRHAEQHAFFILTKREDQARFFRRATEHIENLRIGVTVEGLKYVFKAEGFDFVSVEPMLEPVSFEGCNYKPSWVICGPENGPGARPCNPEWIEALSAQSPVFYDKRPGAARKEFPQWAKV
jgi:protein gp37